MPLSRVRPRWDGLLWRAWGAIFMKETAKAIANSPRDRQPTIARCRPVAPPDIFVAHEERTLLEFLGSRQSIRGAFDPDLTPTH